MLRVALVISLDVKYVLKKKMSVNRHLYHVR